MVLNNIVYILCGPVVYEYCWGCMDWAYGPMAQSEDANQSEDGQLW